MTKLVPEAIIPVDVIEWQPWDEKREAPFVAEGANGVAAWVKVLSRDPDSGAESLIYRLEQGWAADTIRNTVYENLLVLDGELDVGGQTMRKYAFAYRPEGHETGPVATATGATIIAFAGAPGEPASGIAVPHVDVEAMPWTRWPVVNEGARYYIKVLRADEETLDTFYLTRTIVGFEYSGKSSHDAPEESYFLGGKVAFHDGITGGRVIGTGGTYVHRGPFSVHGNMSVLEDATILKRDYWVRGEEDSAEAAVLYEAFPKETAAVKALKEGRDPQLPPRW